MVSRGASSWTAPNILIAILSLVMAALGSYLAIQRNNDEAVSGLRERVRAVEVRVEGLERREGRDGGR
jgi:hypothetical protein